MKKLLVIIPITAMLLIFIKGEDMTLRQSLMKLVYPLVMLKGKLAGSNSIVEINKEMAKPPISFYGLKAVGNDGSIISLSNFEGKKVLIVNTASDCGYTGQFEELEKLHKQHSSKLVVLGFPANDFKQQEKGNDEEIASFCNVNYGVTFPLMKKSSVIKSNNQNEVFRWLTDATRNGWNNSQPDWNFSKYIINEQGVLTHYFGPGISPLSKEVLKAL